MGIEDDLGQSYDACNNFNTKITDCIRGLIGENADRKSEIEALRGDHEGLRKDHDAFVVSAERENDLRKNEIKSLEERQQKDNQARMMDTAKLEGKVDTENAARKAEIVAVDQWAKKENGDRKTEIENLNNFARSENDARKEEIAGLDTRQKSDNSERVTEIAALNQRCDAEDAARVAEDKALNDRIDKEIAEREQAVLELQSRMDSENDDRTREMDELRTRMMKENKFLRALANKPMTVFFNAYRTKAYDGGGEENMTFQGVSCNVGGGMDPESGIFSCPSAGLYMFVLHIATHDNKKALLSIRLNGEEVASVFDQNHKDNHKNSMAGTNILLNLKRGDEVVVYAYTGTWLADFPMNHYTHWIGMYLRPSEDEVALLKKAAEADADEGEVVEANGF